MLVVELAGRLGRIAAPALRTALQDAIADINRPIVIDLQRVDYVSSAGIAVFEEAVDRVQARNQSVALSGLSEAIRITLELAGFLGKVVVEETRDAAVARLGGATGT